MAQNFQFEFEDTAQAQLPDASRFLPSVELRQFFPSQVEAIKPFIGQLMGFISKFRNGDGSETDIDLALHEALANALIHGNGENPDKRVYVACRCDANGEVLITFRDRGQGFDSRNIPDPTDFENRLCTHGSGIYLMRASMDQVYFDEGGAVVRTRKEAQRRLCRSRRPTFPNQEKSKVKRNSVLLAMMAKKSSRGTLEAQCQA